MVAIDAITSTSGRPGWSARPRLCRVLPRSARYTVALLTSPSDQPAEPSRPGGILGTAGLARVRHQYGDYGPAGLVLRHPTLRPRGDYPLPLWALGFGDHPIGRRQLRLRSPTAPAAQ